MDSQKLFGEDKDLELVVDGFVVFEDLSVIELDLFNLYVGEVFVFSFGSFSFQEIFQDCSGGLVWCCVFCNCGEFSLYGQWELWCFELLFDWFWCLVVFFGGSLGFNEVVLFSEDLLQIGFFEGFIFVYLGEFGGFCWVYYWCVVWLVGVWGQEGLELCGVDKVIFLGILQCCFYCIRFGVFIFCCLFGCLWFYYFFCVIVSGFFLFMKILQLLCLEYSEGVVYLEEVCCVVCEGLGELCDLFFCISCGYYYYGVCLDIVLIVCKCVGWQCFECKVC